MHTFLEHCMTADTITSVNKSPKDKELNKKKGSSNEKVGRFLKKNI